MHYIYNVRANPQQLWNTKRSNSLVSIDGQCHLRSTDMKFRKYVSTSPLVLMDCKDNYTTNELCNLYNWIYMFYVYQCFITLKYLDKIYLKYIEMPLAILGQCDQQYNKSIHYLRTGQLNILGRNFKISYHSTVVSRQYQLLPVLIFGHACRYFLIFAS